MSLEELRRALPAGIACVQNDYSLVSRGHEDMLRLCAGAGIAYPEGYRHWTFLHSSMVPATFAAFGKKPCEKPCTAGVFYFYANGKAMEGLRTGSYADGAIIAEEMLEWLSTSAGSKEGQRRLVGVMVKDSQRFADSGGWGYGAFEYDAASDTFRPATTADSPPQENDAKCGFACHTAVKNRDYVFTEYGKR